MHISYVLGGLHVEECKGYLSIDPNFMFPKIIYAH